MCSQAAANRDLLNPIVLGGIYLLSEQTWYFFVLSTLEPYCDYKSEDMEVEGVLWRELVSVGRATGLGEVTHKLLYKGRLTPSFVEVKGHSPLAKVSERFESPVFPAMSLLAQTFLSHVSGLHASSAGPAPWHG